MAIPFTLKGSAAPKHKYVANRISAMMLFAAFFMVLLGGIPARAAVLYQTGFDFSEGYNTNLDLVGQKGWTGAGSGGNGVVSWFRPGSNDQQAYIGFSPPSATDTSLFVYQPINQNAPQVQFSVTFAIIDSSTTNRDDFYWSIFNQQTDQLFTLDFDNQELRVYYYLDNQQDRTWSGLTFTNDGAYQLSIAMNFVSNRWSATLNGAPVATNQLITTTGAPLNLGDIDAAWAIWDPKAPGDNLMVFDSYNVSATIPPPQIKMLGRTNGVPTVQVSGQAGSSFAVEASTNLTSWIALRTNVATAGSFIYADSTANGLSRRFYRARWVP